MLQIASEELRSAPPNQPASMSISDSIDLAFGFIRRQYLIILACLALALPMGVLYVIITPPTYLASALVLLDARVGQFSPDRSIVGETPINSPWIESQLTILKSEQVLSSVVRDLNLVDDPEFSGLGSGLLGSIGAWKVKPVEPKEEDLIQRAIEVLQKNLDVKVVGMSYVIEIKVRAGSPLRAAQIANGISEAYLKDQVIGKSDASRRASDWLEVRLQALRDQLSAAEGAIVEFKSKNNIVATDGKLINEQQLSDLTTRVVAARASTTEAGARLNQIEAALKADHSDSTIISVSDSLNNPIITKLRTEYLELTHRESEYSARYGGKHQAVVKLRDQLRDIRSSIQNELRRIAESYRSDYSIAKKRQEDFDKQAADLVAQSQETNQAQITLRRLQSAAQSYRTLYDNFLQRYTEAQQVFPSSEARVISAASPPSSKSHPRKLLVFAIAAFAGITLGFAIALFRELMDRAFRTSGQVQAEFGAECIALVPRLKATKATISSRPQRTLPVVTPRLIGRDGNAVQAIINSPLSPFSEAIRSIKLAVDLNPDLPSSKIIGLISSVPGEGKSTVAVALGQLIAQTGARVALVDCDLRNPSLSRSIAPRARTGLLDAVFGTEALENTIWTDARTGMAFIPHVYRPHLPHTNEILASEAMRNLFKKVRSSYDYVIVDLSPIAAGADARLTTGFIDAYAFVVKWGETPVDMVRHALHSTRGLQESLLGIILNQVDFSRISRYDDRYGNYHYSAAALTR